MAYAYAPGLKVAEATVVNKERKLPLKGEVLVKVGEHVKAETVVARTYLPGNVEPMNIANRLSCEPKEVAELMKKQVGDVVKKGETLAVSKGFFGLMKTLVPAPRVEWMHISSMSRRAPGRPMPCPPLVLKPSARAWSRSGMPGPRSSNSTSIPLRPGASRHLTRTTPRPA